MSNIDKRADSVSRIIADLKLKHGSGDTYAPIMRWDELLALLDELEAEKNYVKERDEENQDLMLTVGRLRVERETIEAERDNALCELLPGVQYMDPPDGGSVTPLEQVRRMIADYRERIADLEQRHHIKPCPKCNDTGMADSGGTQPWGEPIEIECDCRQQDANTAELVAAGIITKVGE